MKHRAFCLLLLVATVGCFASPKRVNSPSKKVTPSVTPEKSQEPEQPRNKRIEGGLTFTEFFSWSITGETPTATWSPNQKLLAISSDDPGQFGQKFINIFDTTNGKILAKVTTPGELLEPEWLNDSIIGFNCSEKLCGKGKGGIYTLSTRGDLTLLLPLPQTSSGRFYPATENRTFILVSDLQPYPGRGSMPEPTYKWYQIDPATQKISVMENVKLLNGYPAEPVYQNFCASEFRDIFTYSDRGTMLLTIASYSDDEARRLVFANAPPLPRYPGDDLGVFPCFSEGVDKGLYYSRDSNTGLGKVTLIKVEGYKKPQY